MADNLSDELFECEIPGDYIDLGGVVEVVILEAYFYAAYALAIRKSFFKRQFAEFDIGDFAVEGFAKLRAGVFLPLNFTGLSEFTFAGGGDEDNAVWLGFPDEFGIEGGFFGRFFKDRVKQVREGQIGACETNGGLGLKIRRCNGMPVNIDFDLGLSLDPVENLI